MLGKKNYEAYIHAAAYRSDRATGSQARLGEQVRQGLEGVVARYEGDAGQVGAGLVPAVGALDSSRRQRLDRGELENRRYWMAKFKHKNAQSSR